VIATTYAIRAGHGMRPGVAQRQLIFALADVNLIPVHIGGGISPLFQHLLCPFNIARRTCTGTPVKRESTGRMLRNMPKENASMPSSFSEATMMLASNSLR
jgi:hypothetical protein